jgi:hypothetical protein
VTGDAEPRLYLADPLPVRPACRVTNRPAGVERLLAESVDEHVVVLLIPPAAGDLSVALAAQRLRRDQITIIRLGLPGIAGRQVERVIRAAAARGWHPAELAALAGELERYAEVDLIAPGTSLAPFSARRARFRRRVSRVRCVDGRWTPEPASPDAMERALHEALARDRDCAVCISGRKVPAEWVALAHGSREQHVPVALKADGLAAALGATWAVEVLSGPRLDENALSMLRERIVAAPRCGWCGTPIPGRTCVRCAPGLGT